MKFATNISPSLNLLSETFRLIKSMIKHNKNSKSSSHNQSLIHGKHPVLAALLNKKRQIHQIIITKNNQEDLKKFINDNNLTQYHKLINITNNDYINKLLPPNSTHQGLVLKCSPPPTTSHHQFLEKYINTHSQNLPPLLILDNLTDPHNIGAIIRSSSAFNFKNIIIPERSFPLNSPIIAKNSCGMLEITNLIIASNLNNFLLNLKNLGYWIVGLDGKAKTNVNQAKKYYPLALILGSEDKGIRPLVKTNCDLLVKININQEVESLNASNAAAIAMYELNQNKQNE